VEQYCKQVIVMRNNRIDWHTLEKCDKIIFSPGPGLPEAVGVMGKILDAYKTTRPILGVCLGMQYIGIYFGGEIYNIDEIIHGIPKPTQVCDNSEILFNNLPSEFNSGRYHSWALNRTKLPSCLNITASDRENMIMAIRHKTLDICGVQFHPESIMTDHGSQILKNWIES